MFVKRRKQDMLIDKTKLIYLPLLVMLMVIVIVSFVGLFFNKTILLSEMERKNLDFAKHNVIFISKYIENKEAMFNNIEDKLTIAGKIILENKHQVDNNYLKKMAKDFSLADIYYYTPEGELIYSASGEYIGWQPSPGDPIYTFMASNSTILHESIRKSTETDDHYKFSYIKDRDGDFVQLGLMAEDVIAMTYKYDFQKIVSDIAQNESLLYAMILDRNLISIADSGMSDIGVDFRQDHEYQEVLKGDTSTLIVYSENIGREILITKVPLVINGGVEGVLEIGQGLESVESIIRNTFLGIIILSGLIGILVLWLQGKYVISPMINLNNDIQRIDVEYATNLYLPMSNKNPFKGIYRVINHLLKRIHEYISSINNLNMKLGMVVEDTGAFLFEINICERTILFPFGFDNRVVSLKTKKIDLDVFLNQFVEKNEISSIIEAYKHYLDNKGKRFQYEIQKKDISGKKKYYIIHGHKLADTQLILGNIIDVTRLKENESHMEYMAYHNSLTGLPNRRFLLERLGKVLNDNGTGALFLIDLNDIKDINDTLGHVYTDEVIKSISKSLVQKKQENVFISRFGGDVFVMIIIGDEDFIQQTCISTINCIRVPVKVDDYIFEIDCSLGISLFPKDGTTPSELISKADMAMYHVKANYRQGYAYFDPTMLNNIKENNQVHNLLKQAIRNQGFKILFQPIVEARTGKIAGFEALLRLKDYNISPVKFIEIAEEKGLIIDIGRWVARQVISQLSEWK